ncbi:C6 finger domain-containing protein [Diplocarpon rosae]|nr:C6 finger domain-containing protein [Diplocarpon rosae]
METCPARSQVHGHVVVDELRDPVIHGQRAPSTGTTIDPQHIPGQEEARHDRCAAKRNRHQVQFGERALVEVVTGLLDGGDVRRVGDVEAVRVRRERARGQGRDELGRAADGIPARVEAVDDGGEREDLEVRRREMLDVLVEQVVEHRDADDLTQGADDDRERDGRADELVGADDGEDHLTGEQHAADTEQADHERCPGRGDIVGVDGGHRTETWDALEGGRGEGHREEEGTREAKILTDGLDDTEEEQNPRDPLLEDGHQDRADDGPSGDAEADGEEVDARIPERGPVHRVDLDGPEDDDRDEVDAREEADADEEAPVLHQGAREQWIGGPELLVDAEEAQQAETDREAGHDVRRAPRVRLVAPVQADQEQGDAGDGEKGAGEVDASEHVALAQTQGVDAGRRLVPDPQDDEADERQNANDHGHVVGDDGEEGDEE